MDIDRKLNYAQVHIASIAEHDEAEEAAVLAALDGLAKHIKRERERVVARREALRQAALDEIARRAPPANAAG
jgi:hypothetical protein